ncbi:sulfite exporter TauE/SafE family protein [Desulfurispira natronophila]|uniref:Probable membrane transporter protein n=1 Tax=Desulfurispira natronophila TaxID=682562 RepID=A0A7W7Y3P8_9BACT|nr:sulfite exporter TauE/SafE family protein [Desulfurispira natronophila]MBB5021458.1 putative membrane protein YfcA [Desulfurispira natronophila]
MDISAILFFALVGSCAGVIAGTLGVGGGVIIVPALLFYFTAQGMDQAVAIKMAVATSLATIIFTSLSAILAQGKRKAILWPVVRSWTPYILAGAFFSGHIARLLPALALQLFIGCFLLYAAANMLRNWIPDPRRQLPGPAGTAGAGLFVGVVSGMAGIAGGNVIIPLLVASNVAMANAAATSITLALPIALAGSLGFVTAGWSVAALPEWSLGYIYLPALLGIATFTFLAVPLGVAISHRLPAAQLKRIFGILVLIVAVRILWQAVNP